MTPKEGFSVFIRLFSPDAVFVRLKLPSGDGLLVMDLVGAACALFPHWNLKPGFVHVFLVSRAGEGKPQHAAVVDVISNTPPLPEELTLPTAGVACGAWLVVAPSSLNGARSAADMAAFGSPMGLRGGKDLPPPLAFTLQDVGGCGMFVGDLELREKSTAPFFLAPAVHDKLLYFLQEPPSTIPQLLLVTGTIKSGKSRLVMQVIPRLLAHLHASSPVLKRRPVIVSCVFSAGESTVGAAKLLVSALCFSAGSLGISLPLSKAVMEEALDNFPSIMEMYAEALWEQNCVLWLLLDELGAPFIASTPYAALTFTHRLKTAIGLCSSRARIVATGSGMMTLLESFRTASVQSYVLHDALSVICLGREPLPAPALAMARAIHAAYSTCTWDPSQATALGAVITPQRILDALHPDSNGQATSPRPALVAFLMDTMGSGREGDGSPESVLQRALGDVLGKLKDESQGDAAVALGRMPLEALVRLRALAEVDSLVPFEEVGECFEGLGSKLGRVVMHIFEESSPARLMPPYGALLRCWVSREGVLAVRRDEDGSVDLPYSVRKRLMLLADSCGSIAIHAQMAVSSLLLPLFAANGIGVAEVPGAPLSTPKSVGELGSIPAVRCLLAILDKQWALTKKAGVSPSSEKFQTARNDTRPGAQQQYMSVAGFQILVWLRHCTAHAWFPTEDMSRCGFSSTVIVEAVNHATNLLVQQFSREFALDAEGGLRAKPTVL